MSRDRIHEIIVKVRFDSPVTRKEARYAVWNWIHDMDLYGDGKPTKHQLKDGDIGYEPYGLAKIRVRR